MSLRFEHCRYAYGRRGPDVVRDVDVELDDGVTVLLGPNGAGKSTLLALAASVHDPRSGRVTVSGVDSRDRRPYRRLVSWLPQQVDVVAGCTAREQVALAGWLKGMTRSDAWDAAAVALDRVALGDVRDRRTGSLSGGQRSRVGLAQALVHDAPVILLDEPTAALDPAQRHAFRALLSTLANDRVLLVATHDVLELQASSDRVAVLDGGVVRFFGTVAQFHEPVGAAASAVDAYGHWTS